MAVHHLLQETPEASGNFTDTGLRYDCPPDEMTRLCQVRTQLGHGRFAFWTYDAIAVDTNVTLPTPIAGEAPAQDAKT